MALRVASASFAQAHLVPVDSNNGSCYSEETTTILEHRKREEVATTYRQGQSEKSTLRLKSNSIVDRFRACPSQGRHQSLAHWVSSVKLLIRTASTGSCTHQFRGWGGRIHQFFHDSRAP